MKLVYIVFSNRQYVYSIYTIKFQKYIVTTPRKIKENKQTKTQPLKIKLSHDNPTKIFCSGWPEITRDRMDQPTYTIVW